jgi:hypothetical protein
LEIKLLLLDRASALHITQPSPNGKTSRVPPPSYQGENENKIKLGFGLGKIKDISLK